MDKFVLSPNDLQTIKREWEEYVADDPYNHPDEILMPEIFRDSRLNKAKSIDSDFAKLVKSYNNYCSFNNQDNLDEFRKLIVNYSIKYLSQTCGDISKMLLSM